MTTAIQRDKHIRPACMAAAIACLAVLPLGGWSAEGDLKGVGDPTRPPPGVMLKQQQQMVGGAIGQFVNPNGAVVPNAAAPAASAASDAEAQTNEFTGDKWAVTGIRIDKGTGQGVAIIGEDVVRVGDTLHGMKVVSITFDEVQIKGPDGMRKLKFSDVNELSGVTPVRSAKRGRKERK